MTISGIFASLMHFIWTGVGIFVSLIIIGALVFFLYEQIKGFTKYVISKYFTKKTKENKENDKHE